MIFLKKSRKNPKKLEDLIGKENAKKILDIILEQKKKKNNYKENNILKNSRPQWNTYPKEHFRDAKRDRNKISLCWKIFLKNGNR